MDELFESFESFESFEPLDVFRVVGIVVALGTMGFAVNLWAAGHDTGKRNRPTQSESLRQTEVATPREKAAKPSSVGHASEQRYTEKEKTTTRVESEIARLEVEKATALSSAEELDNSVNLKGKGTGKVVRQAEDVERLEPDLQQCLQRERTLESEVSHLRQEATKRERLIHDLSVTNQQQLEEIKQMKTTFSTSTDIKQISRLLSPTNADSISVAEVADLVRILNAQIEQTSSLILDSLFDQESPNTGKELEIVWDELNDYIGTWLCNDLKRRSKEHIVEPDPLIMQITLQTGLVSACSRIINDWNPPFWIDGLVFSRTYSSIEKAAGQATADAWKALSRTHMTVLQSERQEANKRFLTDVLLKLITAIGGSSESAGSLLSQYNEKVEDIVKKAVGLHKTISEDVTSMELVTYTSPSNTPFDGSQMEDTEGDKGKRRSGKVVCTVDMGLRCRKRNGLGNKNGSGEGWGVTMKSRVVLAATLRV